MDIFVNANLLKHFMHMLNRSSPIKQGCDHVMKKPLCDPDIKGDQGFERCKPEDKGISSYVISAFLDEAVNKYGLDLHGVTIIKDGAIICEAQIGAYHPEIYHACHSLSKTVTAMAIGMLIDEGLLSLDDKAAKLLEKRVSPIHTLGYRTLTVRHLLTMTSGASFSEAGVAVEKNWLRAYFESGVSFRPGERFHYNSLNSYVLSCIVKEVSGEGLSSFLEKRLFSKMGIKNYHWELSPEGVEAGGWGLYLTREDAAKLGRLYLDKGMWNGKRLISEEWIKLSTKPWVKTPDEYGAFDYGFHLWCDKHGKTFLFNGMFCQDVLVIKDKRIIIATNGGVEQLFQQSEYYKLIDKYFVSDNVAVEKKIRLKPLLTRLKNGKRRIIPMRLPSEMKKLIGTDFYAEDYSSNPFKGAQMLGNALSVGSLPMVEQMLRNSYAAGIRSITLNKEGKTVFLDINEADGIKRIPITLGKWKKTVLSYGVTSYHAAAYSTVSKNEDGLYVLKVRLIFPEVASTRIIKICYDRDSILVRMLEQPGMTLIRMFTASIEDALKKKKTVADIVSLFDSDAVFCKLEKRFEPVFMLYKK